MKTDVELSDETIIRYHLSSMEDFGHKLNPKLKAMLIAAPSIARENARLRSAILWALGENGQFRQRPDLSGPYYWRKELRRRAFEIKTSPTSKRRGGT